MSQSTTSPPELSKQPLEQLEDYELVTVAQQDNRQAMRALELLVKRKQKTVYLALYHLSPERNDLQDLTQEVLLRMCRSIKSIKNPKTFKYWLNRIITNLFYDQLRKKPRQLRTVSTDLPIGNDQDGGKQLTRDIPDETDRPDDNMLNSELELQIKKSIDQLPEHLKTVVVLREMQGLTYDEIAGITKVNLGTVKSRLARARQRLKENLAPYLSGTIE